MNITSEFDVGCATCLDTGEYYDGKKMVRCSCEAGKKLDNDNKGKLSKVSKSNSKRDLHS